MTKARRKLLSRRRGMAGCRQGQHRLGPGTEAGGGIVRRNCLYCGVLSIDLTGVGPSRPDAFVAERRLPLAPATEQTR
ncbi:MAG: hypothetical protein ACT4OP_08680 [Actinomycetota bacterium]